MTTRTIPRICTLLAAIAAVVAFGLRPARSALLTVSLDVPGRSDATPWVAAWRTFVAVAWGATSEGKTDVFIAVSRDGGSTFGSPIQVNAIAGEARLGGELPPRVALMSKPGASVPEIAVLWTARAERTAIKVARSEDGGRTFSPPVELQSLAAAGDRGWPAVAFDQHAGIHAIWLDHRGMAAARTAGTGRPAHTDEAHDGVAMAQRSSLYYAAVAAQVSRERELTNGVCYCCKTALAAGPNGALYAAWRHVYPGNFRDIAFTMSTDGGRSFATPIRIREDGWAIDGCPDDGPAMVVGAGGVVHVAWPTVIGGDKPEGAIFYASTRDGRRFSPGIRIPTLGGPKPSHPQIAIDGGGRTFVAWDDSVHGRRVPAMRELRLASNRAATFGDIVVLAPEGGMYPVLAATAGGVVAVWSTGGAESLVKVRLVRSVTHAASSLNHDAARRHR